MLAFFHFQHTLKTLLNIFSTNVSLLYPLKTSENRRLSDVFREYRSGTLVENGLTIVSIYIDIRIVPEQAQLY